MGSHRSSDPRHYGLQPVRRPSSLPTAVLDIVHEMSLLGNLKMQREALDDRIAALERFKNIDVAAEVETMALQTYPPKLLDNGDTDMTQNLGRRKAFVRGALFGAARESARLGQVESRLRDYVARFTPGSVAELREDTVLHELLEVLNG
jgi:hypothetical protein